jgi:uncharacterized membrane protein
MAGSAIFGVGLGYEYMLSNHPQMTYYLAMCIGILSTVLNWSKVYNRNKIIGFITAISLILVGSILLALGASASRMWTAYEYTKSTMRGGQVLKAETSSANKPGRKLTKED